MRRIPSASLALALALAPAAASGEQLSLRGWGPRIGVGDDPDQLVVGVHADLGQLAHQLRLQPNIELGIGDDHTILSASAAVHYRFAAGGDPTPYAGGGILLAAVDRDRPAPGRGEDGDETEIDLGPFLVGGIEWPLAAGGDLFFEFHLVAADVHDAKLLVGWMLRRR